MHHFQAVHPSKPLQMLQLRWTEMRHCERARVQSSRSDNQRRIMRKRKFGQPQLFTSFSGAVRLSSRL